MTPCGMGDSSKACTAGRGSRSRSGRAGSRRNMARRRELLEEDRGQRLGAVQCSAVQGGGE